MLDNLDVQQSEENINEAVNIMRELERKAEMTGVSKGQISAMAMKLIAEMKDEEFLALQRKLRQQKKIRLRFKENLMEMLREDAMSKQNTLSYQKV
jgi:hypothetical protein